MLLKIPQDILYYRIIPFLKTVEIVHFSRTNRQITQIFKTKGPYHLPINYMRTYHPFPPLFHKSYFRPLYLNFFDTFNDRSFEDIVSDCQLLESIDRNLFWK